MNADHYEDKIAADPRVDKLREKMVCIENKQYSQDYLDPHKRSITNAVQIFFKDGSKTDCIEIEYPLGHRRRRQEAIPLLMQKFENNLGTLFDEKRRRQIISICNDAKALHELPVNKFLDLLTDYGIGK